MKKGFVSLVGAGPGDPELLTVKALKRIREADLIIYDYLVNPEHLRHAKKDCAVVSVGKGFRHKLMSQKIINRRIIAEAKKGKNVVRLKGGDPYLFGRGGEEALFLKKNGIDFDVVPGITSAVACANYAGIPLTHREHNSSVTFLTGHRAHDETLDTIDWKRIAAMPGTLVIYMGFYNLPVIARKLIANGMRSDTPAAVVEWGTMPHQKTCTGTLKDIASRVKKAALKPPCIIVIGDVVKLRPKLDWYEQLPLFGKKVLVTRSHDKASVLSEKLRELGAQPIELPTIVIRPADKGPLDRSIRAISRSQYDWLIFTSAYGVEAYFQRLNELNGDSRSVRAKVACVGPGTADALRRYGIEPDIVPERFETAALPDAIQDKYGDLHGFRMLLVRTDIAPIELERRLKKAGARVERVTGYRTRRAVVDRAQLKGLLSQPPDYLSFASSSAVTNLANVLGVKKMKALASKSTVASIGPVTTKTLRALGLRIGCQASSYHIEGLTDAIARHAGRRK